MQELKVVRSFKGVPDGATHPRIYAEGDTVFDTGPGSLGRVALEQGWAESAAAGAPTAAACEAGPQIPDDWRGMKWMQRQALARKIKPGFNPAPNDRIASIDAVIEAELVRRGRS